MWISKQLQSKESAPAAECGEVTMTSEGELETKSSGVERSVKVYSPFGYAFCAPKGEKVLLTQGGGEQVSLGVETDCSGLDSGEIKLSSPSGAYIYLKSDGTVIINGLAVSKEGKFIEQQ